MSTNNGHIAIRLADFNLIDKNDYVSKELLLNYNNNDLIIPQEDGEVFSFQNYINKINNLKMSIKDHNTNNCHPFVSDKTSGYLSNTDYLKFTNNTESINKIIDLIMKLIDKHMYSVDELDYVLNGNTLTIKECKIRNLLIDASISDINFTLNNTNIKFQTNKWIKIMLVKLDILNNQISIIALDKNEEDKILYDNDIYYWNDITKTYKNENVQFTFIPLLEIDMISKYIKLVTNTEVNDIDDILEKELSIINKNENPYETVSLISNIYKLNNNNENILLSIPFNKDENEIINGNELNKQCNYKSSPFGFMMINSRNIGYPINVPSFKDFILEFYTDKDYLNIKAEEIITINYSSNVLISISLSKDTIKINDTELQFDLNENNKYMEFSIIKKASEIIIRYGSAVKIIKLDGITNTTKFDNLIITSLNTPLGNVNLFKYFDNYNNAINHNLFSNNTIITNNAKTTKFRSIEFDLNYNSSDSRLFNLNIPNTENDIIKSGDCMQLSFFNRICNNTITLSDEASFLIVDNKICRNAINTNLKLNIGDNIMVNEIDVYKVIDNFEGTYYLDKCILEESDKINISVIYPDNNSFFNLYINDILFTNYSIRIIDNSYSIVFREDININSKFKIEFNEELTSDLIIEDINDIQQVTFCDVPSILYKKNEIVFTENSIKIKYNEEILENNDIMIALDSKEVINIKLLGTISKFKNYAQLLDLFNIEVVIAITGGSNDIEIINNNIKSIYNTESKIVKLNIPITSIDENGNFDIDIKTTGNVTNSKLIITDVVINTISKIDLLYAYFNNQLNYITDYLFIDNGEVIYNTCEQVAILCKRRNKAYIRNEDCTITKTLDDDVIIYVNNELFNNEKLILSKRYIYNEG